MNMPGWNILDAPSDIGHKVPEWKPLAYFNYYRLVLSGLFVILFVSGPMPSLLGSHNPSLFLGTAVFYLVFSLFSLFSIYARAPGFSTQTQLQTLVDIVALTLLMHGSGGLTTGLGILMVIAIAGSSMILAGRLALLFAAVASIAILIEQIYAQLNESFATTSYTQAGILGATFFATALLSHVLAARIRKTEELAAQRGVDLANMQQVNEYIIQTMDAGIIVVDHDMNTRLVNESAWHYLGMPKLKQYQPLDQVSEELAAQLHNWKQDPDIEIKPFRPHADAANILARFTPLGQNRENGTLILLEDSSHVTQQLQQMKLASLGRLTASIAHEIRNPLGAISHAAQLLQESPGLEGADYRLSEIIQDHSARMNTIVENILQLSRRDSTNPKIIELKAWIEDFCMEFCNAEQLEPDCITVDIQPENTMIQMDTSHLQQILWNLCQNAIKYGHHEDQPIRITLRGGITEESKGPFLDVIDTGEGILPEIAEQIFEPFFTTSNEGTGLGLYISKEMCECNKARISYHVVPGGGSCFRLSFFDPRRIKQ
jgi:two-component system sensor histidine kinase PilS (NtrC family)